MRPGFLLVIPFTITMLLWTNHMQNPDRVRGFIAGLGYADIRMEGRYTNTCGRGDREYPFHAVAASGQPVHGEVCAGLLGYFLASYPDRTGR
jgi:hypothetical protein